MLRSSLRFTRRFFCSNPVDITILGGGAAGTAAAISARYEGYSVRIIEKRNQNGLFSTTPQIHNVPGFPGGISGHNYSENLRKQLTQMGVDCVYNEGIVRISQNQRSPTFHLHSSNQKMESQYLSKSVIFATGVTYRKLDLPHEDTLKSVFYEVTPYISSNIRGKKVLIYGAGNSAGQAAVFYHSLGAQVTIIFRSGYLEERMSAYLIHRIHESDMNIIPWSQILDVQQLEENRLSITAQTEKNLFEIVSDYLFVMIGGIPSILPCMENTQLHLDKRGYLIVDDNMQTNVPGIFAAGDIQHRGAGRILLAQSQGVQASQSAIQYVENVNLAEIYSRTF